MGALIRNVRLLVALTVRTRPIYPPMPQPSSVLSSSPPPHPPMVRRHCLWDRQRPEQRKFWSKTPSATLYSQNGGLVAGETSQVLFSFHTHQVSVSDALFYLMASAVALLWIGIAWRVIR
jgi:hypothetical protein